MPITRWFFDQFTALPMQIYYWANQPKQNMQDLASAGIVVLVSIIILNELYCDFYSK